MKDYSLTIQYLVPIDMKETLDTDYDVSLSLNELIFINLIYRCIFFRNAFNDFFYSS